MKEEPAPPADRKRWKLWHFAVLVLIAAPIFATIRGLAGSQGRPIDAVPTLVVVALAALAPLAILRGTRKLTGGAAKSWQRWGVDRGGVIGFFAWLVGIGTEVGFFLVAIVVGPVATIALFLWLARLAGR